LAAFSIYAWVVETRCAGAPDVEITIFTMAFQGVGYLVAMAVANVFYNLGRWSEVRLQPHDIASFRKWVWGLGLAISVALPFTVPVMVAARCVTAS
jgi:hypothetical protein